MLNWFVIYADMWSPAAAAVATCWLFGKKLAALRLVAPQARYAWLGYGLPLLAACLAYPVLWTSGLAPARFAEFEANAQGDLALGGGASLVVFALVATIGVIRSCSSALGEELGWRGLLVPALHEHMRFSGVVIASGLIWGAWHLPLMLLLPGAPPLLSLLLFFVGIVAAAGIAAWLRLRSGSVWPAMFFHASHNVFLQLFFDPLTVTNGRAALPKFGGVPARGEDRPAASYGGIQACAYSPRR